MKRWRKTKRQNMVDHSSEWKAAHLEQQREEAEARKGGAHMPTASTRTHTSTTYARRAGDLCMCVLGGRYRTEGRHWHLQPVWVVSFMCYSVMWRLPHRIAVTKACGRRTMPSMVPLRKTSAAPHECSSDPESTPPDTTPVIAHTCDTRSTSEGSIEA